MFKSKFALLILVSLFFIGCKGDKEKPVFKSLVNLSISDLTKKKIEIRGNLVFLNPSEQNITFKKCLADFTLGGVDLNTFYNNNELRIKGNKEFTIPIYLLVDPDEVKDKTALQVVIKTTGEFTYENDEGKSSNFTFSDKQTINVDLSKNKSKKGNSKELSEKEIKKLEKKLKKGKIDSLEYQQKINQ